MFGQAVVGPPGSGKSTYCEGMHEFLNKLGRKVAIINLDPANDNLPYTADVDIMELINIDDPMDHFSLGPNGSLVYCMSYLLKNLEWLTSKLDALKNRYLLIDFPGQVELYTHDTSVRDILDFLVNKYGLRLTCVHLVDSHYCTDAGKFISVLLTSLSTMLHLALPHVNILSKADLIEQFGKLPFNVDYFTDVLDLEYLIQTFSDDPLFTRYRHFNQTLAQIIEDNSLISFTLLDIQDKDAMFRTIRRVDQANGYVFGDTEDRNIQSLLSFAIGAEFEYAKIQSVRERHVTMDDDEPHIDFFSDET